MILVLSQNFIAESDTAGPLEQRPLFTDEKAEARRVTRLACATLAFPRLSLAWVPVSPQLTSVLASRNNALPDITRP